MAVWTNLDKTSENPNWMAFYKIVCTLLNVKVKNGWGNVPESEWLKRHNNQMPCGLLVWTLARLGEKKSYKEDRWNNNTLKHCFNNTMLLIHWTINHHNTLLLIHWNINHHTHTWQGKKKKKDWQTWIWAADFRLNIVSMINFQILIFIFWLCKRKPFFLGKKYWNI